MRDPHLQRATRVFAALSDPNRMRLAFALRHGECCVCQLVELLGLAPSTVSKHLSILRAAGLVTTRKEGRWVYCRLADPLPLPLEGPRAPALLRAALAAPAVRTDDRRLRTIRRQDMEALCRKLFRKDCPAMKTRILFLCTGNSCRSQMAEGWARHLKKDTLEAYSAGLETHGLNPFAVKAMAEAGVDISSHRSKHVDELRNTPLDVVVTVCGHADETCPAWLGAKARVIHVGFDDPPKLARSARTEEEALSHYRRVRDEIRAFVAGLPENLPPSLREVRHE